MQDRAHRIGQTKQVYVFRFLTEEPMEEKIVERALQKQRLYQLVMQWGKVPSANKSVTSNYRLQMIHYGAKQVLDSATKRKGDLCETLDIEYVLKIGEEKTQKLQQKYAKLWLDELQQQLPMNLLRDWSVSFLYFNHLNWQKERESEGQQLSIKLIHIIRKHYLALYFKVTTITTKAKIAYKFYIKKDNYLRRKCFQKVSWIPGVWGRIKSGTKTNCYR